MQKECMYILNENQQSIWPCPAVYPYVRTVFSKVKSILISPMAFFTCFVFN